MLGININNEFLDLAPATELEMEDENPGLQLNDELVGEFSLPFEVLATPKNLRLLNFSAIMENRVSNVGIDAVIFDNGIPTVRGKIKIEKPSINMNRIGEGRISCYFLSGASSFYQDIKDKRLQHIDMGGSRSFAWGGYTTTGPDFWGHVSDTMNASPGYGNSGRDYAFFPIKNTAWPGRGTTDLMNRVHLDSGNFYLSQLLGSIGDSEPNRIVPFPYLKYVLERAALYVGWQIAGDILSDDDFKKIVLINFRGIDWGYQKKAGSRSIIPRDPVVFNLQDHLPDTTIARFFIALKNRFGWWYDFDKATKTIYIRELENVAIGEIKDMTERSSPLIVKTINQSTKRYALRNTFSSDLGSGEPNFDVVNFIGPVDELTDLPAAAEARYGEVYLVVAENNFYICLQNDSTEAWEWVLYAYNVYDYVPENPTDEITTEATTIGVERYDSFLDLIPRIDQQGAVYANVDAAVDWGIILCFNHGVRDNKNNDPYPYGSSHVYDSKFVQVGNWALTFECKLAGGVTDVGLYERNWRRLLDMLKSQEEADVKLYLNRTEFVKLAFSDQLVIRNVRFFIKTRKPKLPFNGEVNLRLVRV